MKKIFVFGIACVLIFASLSFPSQIVKATTNRVDIQSWITGVVPVDPGEVWTNEGGMTFWRGVTNNIYYTSTDTRMQGWSTLVMNRNIRPDGSAQGHGTWVSHPDAHPDGYWSGTFTASIDSLGVMRVSMIAKGYGTLDGLRYSASLEGSMMSIVYGVITELPNYTP